MPSRAAPPWPEPSRPPGLGALVESGGLEPRAASGVNQVDNSSTIIQDLRDAALNLQRMLEAEFKA